RGRRSSRLAGASGDRRRLRPRRRAVRQLRPDRPPPPVRRVPVRRPDPGPGPVRCGRARRGSPGDVSDRGVTVQFPPPLRGRVRVGVNPLCTLAPTLTLPRRGGGNLREGGAMLFL